MKWIRELKAGVCNGCSEAAKLAIRLEVERDHYIEVLRHCGYSEDVATTTAAQAITTGRSDILDTLAYNAAYQQGYQDAQEQQEETARDAD